MSRKPIILRAPTTRQAPWATGAGIGGEVPVAPAPAPVEEGKTGGHEAVSAPCLDAAYNLARWLSGNDRGAEALLLDACARGCEAVSGLSGKEVRIRLLALIHEAFYSSPRDAVDPSPDAAYAAGPVPSLAEAFMALPSRLRETLVLRELEGLSYAEIAEITGMTLPAVASTLACARSMLSRWIETKQG
ncbi:MAG TPA: sigma factor-like helix-turn-helix DNA-binding protein [Nevskia sp.]|nr:sigma factor-like helix-turn-helix DNA-binding protein [Nevskia sp.]